MESQIITYDYLKAVYYSNLAEQICKEFGAKTEELDIAFDRAVNCINQSHVKGLSETLAKFWRGELYELVNDPDWEWKQQLKNGDQNAWEQVYTKCYNSVLAMLISPTFYCPKEDVRDIFQEAVIVLHKYLNDPNKRVNKSVEAFLKGVAKNIRRNITKGVARQYNLENNLLQEDLISRPNTISFELFDVDERYTHLILKHLEKLSEEDRGIIRAAAEGCSMDQIAERFHIEGNTLEKRRTNTRQRLFHSRKRFKKSYFNDPDSNYFTQN